MTAEDPKVRQGTTGWTVALGFTESKEDSNLYFKVKGGRPVMLLLYVDDMFLTEKEELFKDARRRLAIKFKMKYLGIMHYFLGMEVWHNAYDIFPWLRKVCSGYYE